MDVPIGRSIWKKPIAHADVDVVCISLPNNLHEAAVLLCCKHKKAVITTKPLGRNAAEAKRMLEAVEKAGIFNGYLEDLVYTPKFLKAYESVKNGALGRILWSKIQRNTSWSAQRLVLGSGTGRWRMYPRSRLPLRGDREEVLSVKTSSRLK